MLNNISKMPINQPSGKPHLASMNNSRENKTAKLINSPQYSLKITKPGKVYVVFRLKEKLNR